MTNTRQPAVAGMFYPADPRELRSTILQMLVNAKEDLPIPKAIISPHAGYIYSGPIAANAFACLAKAANTIKRVVLLGPAHRALIQGLAAPQSDIFATPLGQIRIDHEAIAQIASLTHVQIDEEAHRQEHSLEVQLPFLQILLKEFSLIPLVVGMASTEQVATAIKKLWGGPETLIVVSSDLSHYCDYKTAQKLDHKAANAILQLDPEALATEQACGHAPIQGLLQVAREKKLKATLIDLRNSGDTQGAKDQVVGYGAFHFFEPKE